MKRNIILSVGFVFALIASGTLLDTTFGQTPQDSPLLVEDFNYTAGDRITAYGWTAHSAGGTNPILVTAPGLTYAGYPSSGVGNAVTMTTSGEDDNKTFPSRTTGTVYASLLVNVSAATTTGDYFFHLAEAPLGTVFRGRLFVKKDALVRGRLFVKKDALDNLAFGISKASTTSINYTPFSYALNTTYLIVMKYTIVTGATNDTVDLFINPVLSGAEPAANVSAPDVTAVDPNSIGAVALRQGSTTTSSVQRVDGIREGLTWTSLSGTFVPPDANVDMNGDGKTDYVVVRGTGSPLTEDYATREPTMFASYRDRKRYQMQNAGLTPSVIQAYWYVALNGGGGYSVPWGDAGTDVFISEDFDGDRKDDMAVWRPGNPGAFYILYSATNTGSAIYLGSEWDDPTVVGDYDGDGKADPAVYSCPSPTGPAGNCFFRYIGSMNNPGQTVTSIFWGVGVALQYAPAPGDFDGDGKHDFSIRCEKPGSPGQAQYALMRSSDFGQEQIDFGLITDWNEPGDYDGDGKSDFMVARGQSGNMVHYLLTRTGSFTVLQWGLASDVPTPGDYDGDGKSDVSVFRPATSPAGSTFYSISLSRGFISAVQWGSCLQPCDYPVANYFVQ